MCGHVSRELRGLRMNYDGVDMQSLDHFSAEIQ